MKTLKLRMLSATIAIMVLSIAGLTRSSFAQTILSAPTPVKFQDVKADIKGDLAAVKYHNDRIAFLEKKYKADKEAGREITAIEDQRALTRTKGELAMSKAYLKSDKKMLIEKHNMTIDARKDAICAERSKLSEAKNKLDKDIAIGREDLVDNDAVAVVRHQRNLENHKAALSRERSDKNSDLVAVNKDIKRLDGQPATTLYAETAVANTRDWLDR